MQTQSENATLIFFNKYTVHYFSQSSAPWEAAYINCFYEEHGKDSRQAGYIVFTYTNGMRPPGQEGEATPGLPIWIPAGQENHLDATRAPFFVIYYDLGRFGDVINLLQHCVAARQSMLVSADPNAHVWALCNNEHVPVGAR